MLIGLTGGIATGKSTIAAMLAKLGAGIVKVVEADKLGHALYAKTKPCYRKLVRAFGSTILKADGRIDRPVLRRLVFGDPAKLRLLDRITWPAIKAEIKKIKAGSRGRLVVLDAAVLFEAGWHKLCDKVILVHVDKATQLQRLSKFGYDSRTIKGILASQANYPFERKKKLADYVIYNKDLAMTQRIVAGIWNNLKLHLEKQK